MFTAMGSLVVVFFFSKFADLGIGCWCWSDADDDISALKTNKQTNKPKIETKTKRGPQANRTKVDQQFPSESVGTSYWWDRPANPRGLLFFVWFLKMVLIDRFRRCVRRARLPARPATAETHAPNDKRKRERERERERQEEKRRQILRFSFVFCFFRARKKNPLSIVDSRMVEFGDEKL